MRAWRSDGSIYLAVDGKEYPLDEANRLGFVPQSLSPKDATYVQADAFQVRGVIRRGDAQLIDQDELRDLVLSYLADHGVELAPLTAPPRGNGILQVFWFNYSNGLNLDDARERDAFDRIAAAQVRWGIDYIKRRYGTPRRPG